MSATDTIQKDEEREPAFGFWRRSYAMLVKEFIQLRRDRLTPLLQHLARVIHSLSGRDLVRLDRSGDVGGDLHHPAGMDDPHRHPLLLTRKALQIRLGPDDRKGAAVNLRAVADIVERSGQLVGPWVCVAAICRR